MAARSILRLALSLLVLVSPIPTRAADSFSFTTIDVPGADDTYANGINASGQIVGVFTDAGKKRHGFLRISDGTITTIDVPDANSTSAQGINDAGQIVGYFTDTGGKGHGFLRASDATITTIDIPDATETRAFGINASGQIVGYFTDTGGKKEHGFLRTPNGIFTTIDVHANGINASGQIVGWFDAGYRTHGFLRTSDGTRTTFDVPGVIGTIAEGINTAGQIVGFFCYASGGPSFQGVPSVAIKCDHGFLRTPDGTFTTIDVPGATETGAFGINASGQIVGNFTKGGKRHGFVATR